MRKNWDIVTSRHHRKMRTNGGTNDPKNMSVVPHNKHVAFHILFGDKTTQQIADVLNEIWIDPDFELIVKPRKQ